MLLVKMLWLRIENLDFFARTQTQGGVLWDVSHKNTHINDSTVEDSKYVIHSFFKLFESIAPTLSLLSHENLELRETITL